MVKVICAKCIYFAPKDKGITGQCRANAPTVIPLSKQSTVLIDTEIRSVFPEVAFDDWCRLGEADEDFVKKTTPIKSLNNKLDGVEAWQ